MAIGTLGAIALGISALGGVASAASNSNASRAAVNASQQATQENNALSREIYGQNRQTLAPFVNQGNVATSYINQLLGIQTPQQPAMGGFDTTRPFASPADDFYSGFGGERGFDGGMGFGAMGAPNAFAFQQPSQPQQPTAQPGAAQSGFDAFRNSTGYQFRLGEGMRAIEGSQAARGLSRSGDTLKRMSGYGQDMASAEFGNYLNTLLGQQSLGSNTASAQAGVANAYSSQVQANNAQNASNIGNAALARAGGNNAMLSGLLNAGAYAIGGRK